jgi:hypothetical protein
MRSEPDDREALFWQLRREKRRYGCRRHGPRPSARERFVSELLGYCFIVYWEKRPCFLRAYVPSGAEMFRQRFDKVPIGYDFV